MLRGGIRKGADWPDEIDIALSSASVIVLFWSRSWDPDRAVLAREHGIALSRHRAGEAAYVPVFLDAPSALPEALTRYRAESGDVVQGFDVAQSGNDNWNALLDTVEELWRHRSDRSVAGAGELSGWSDVLGGEPTTEDAAALLRRLPAGPAVDRFSVPSSLPRAFANGTTPISAPQLVASAGALVLKLLERTPPNAHAFIVSSHELPVPDRGLSAYWSHVFDHACVLGPRMVAAILLSAPPPVLHGIRSDAVRLLESMEAM